LCDKYATATQTLQIRCSAKAKRNGAGVGECTDFFVSLASFTYVKEATPTITQRTPLLRRKALICAILMAIMGILKVEITWRLF